MVNSNGSYTALKQMERDNISARVEVVGNSSFFHDLDSKGIRSLIEQSDTVGYEKGEFILRQGQIIEHFHLVLQGRIKVFTMTPSGKKIILDIYHSGEPFHIAPLVSGNPSDANALAVEDSVILRMGKTSFFAFLMQHPPVALRFLEIFSSRLSHILLRARDCIIDKANDRLLFTLQALNRRFGDSLKFTSAEISELSGTTTETAIRFMHLLKEEGLVSINRGNILVKDANKLQDYRVK
ncbi:MAG TPA: Crp/Fnr family transcriptional regulator [Dehalococcoidia bacterium]|nr:Crp/Fnr family transcriptional regulator [Dehalococcoidia bacterium]